MDFRMCRSPGITPPEPVIVPVPVAEIFIYITVMQTSWCMYRRSGHFLILAFLQKKSRFTWVNIARAFMESSPGRMENCRSRKNTTRTSLMKRIPPNGSSNILFTTMESGFRPIQYLICPYRNNGKSNLAGCGKLPEPVTHHQLLTARFILVKSFTSLHAQVTRGNHIGEQGT